MKLISLLCFLAILPVDSPIVAEEVSNSVETLKQYVLELQIKPDDAALREKIIKLVLTLKPAPAIPNEAIELKGAATAAIKNAKSESDYADVVEAYKKLSLAVPWAAGVYFNLAKMQEKIGKTGDAVTSYNFYLMAAPGAKDANVVREHIGVLKFVMEKNRYHDVDEQGRRIYNEFEIENSKALEKELDER